ncbi:MAG: phosphatase PAP2 family protein [Actinobacteria bacterium]|nr:phosphatase PAP2 family protein [Actinomycetota bacterium]
MSTAMSNMASGVSPVRRRAVDVLLLIAAIAVALLYLPLNHPRGAHIVQTALDPHTPLVPVFAVPYLAFLPIFWLTLLAALLTQRRYRAFVITIIIVYCVSDVVYALYQTYVPRPSVEGGGPFNALVRFVYSNDHPYNDLPSEHASSATMFAAYLLAIRSRWWLAGCALGASVVAATLLLHQHFLPGALTGVLLGALTSVIVYRRVRD